MFIEWFVTCLYLVSGLLLLLSIRFMMSIFKLSWFLPFRILKFLLTFTISAIVFLAGQQFSAYQSDKADKPLAAVHMRHLDVKKYLLTLTIPDNDDTQRSFVVNGDMWQLDVRVISWHTWLYAIGFETLYKFERLSGRYASVDDEMIAPRSIYPLVGEQFTDSLWPYFVSYAGEIIFNAYFGSAVYAPMFDHAKYGVYLTATGTEVLPLNESAKTALKSW